ncbi:non-canonical purine NTP diphosphatase [Porphyromonas pogonae]|uniref:non-canonical purine NTP diphosphatase n=1 Tax=Porphyromonas pogonae TaxID=867595 RepID=UPI002E78401B|nr:non-canonical purine NTP diphosphatase [Porphyromonas pogonae]
MEKLVFATNNRHKLHEIKAMLGDKIEILSLEDINCNEEIPETEETLEGNALQKIDFVYDKYGHYCFADDTGLAVEALGGAPGVYTARYAGEDCKPEDNIRKLLKELEGIPTPRKAIFSTVIALIDEDGKHLFRGDVQGSIAEKKSGSDGFGYDPVFIPEGYNITFAEMDEDEKNSMSHRGKAVAKLIDYLHKRNKL